MALINGRPDLSFLTSKRFDTVEEFLEFLEDLPEEQQIITYNVIMKIPELVCFAESSYDEKKPGNGMTFQMIETTLHGFVK